MTCLSLLDDELRELAAMGTGVPIDFQSLPERREQMRRVVEGCDPSACLSIPAPAGHVVHVRLHGRLRSRKPRAAIVHLHGGGFVLGDAAMMDKVNARRAATLGCLLVSVDYRLAPEFPFPAQLGDAYAALCWLAASAEEFAVDPERIATVGESAGAGLAAALALYARDCGGPTLCHQHLLYPMLDDRTGQLSNGLGHHIWTAGDNRFGWSALLGGADAPGPYAAPARAASLAGLPPAFIAVGALDLFLPECLEYASRLACAGVPVEAHVYPGMVHAAEIFAPHAGVSKRLLGDSRRALQRALITSTREAPST